MAVSLKLLHKDSQLIVHLHVVTGRLYTASGSLQTKGAQFYIHVHVTRSDLETLVHIAYTMFQLLGENALA